MSLIALSSAVLAGLEEEADAEEEAGLDGDGLADGDETPVVLEGVSGVVSAELPLPVPNPQPTVRIRSMLIPILPNVRVAFDLIVANHLLSKRLLHSLIRVAGALFKY